MTSPPIRDYKQASIAVSSRYRHRSTPCARGTGSHPWIDRAGRTTPDLRPCSRTGDRRAVAPVARDRRALPPDARSRRRIHHRPVTARGIDPAPPARDPTINDEGGGCAPARPHPLGDHAPAPPTGARSPYAGGPVPPPGCVIPGAPDPRRRTAARVPPRRPDASPAHTATHLLDTTPAPVAPPRTPPTRCPTPQRQAGRDSSGCARLPSTGLMRPDC